MNLLTVNMWIFLSLSVIEQLGSLNLTPILCLRWNCIKPLSVSSYWSMESCWIWMYTNSAGASMKISNTIFRYPLSRHILLWRIFCTLKWKENYFIKLTNPKANLNTFCHYLNMKSSLQDKTFVRLMFTRSFNNWIMYIRKWYFFTYIFCERHLGLIFIE